MLKQIEVCDMCQSEEIKNSFKVPFYDDITCFGGKGGIPIIKFGKSINTKKLVLCEECTNKIARALTYAYYNGHDEAGKVIFEFE